jgi:hypothetical protein
MSFHVENSTENFGVLTTSTLNAANIGTTTAIIDSVIINDNLNLLGTLNVTGDVEVGGNLDVLGALTADTIKSQVITADTGLNSTVYMTQIPSIMGGAGYITLNGTDIDTDIAATFIAGRLGGTIVLSNISGSDFDIASGGVIDIQISYPIGYGVTADTVGVVSLGTGSVDSIDIQGGLSAYSVICGVNTVNIYLSASVDISFVTAKTLNINFILFQVITPV